MSEQRVTSEGLAGSAAWHGWAAWGLIAWFFLTTVGVLPLLSQYRGDERFYTNAAVLMHENGDWLTPRWSTGEPRLNKPILSYWAIAGSQGVFGFTHFASRLPMALAGAGTLWLTWRLGRRLLAGLDEAGLGQGEASRGTLASAGALVAVGVLASNPQLMKMAERTTPDMMQTLLVTLSIWGVAGLAGKAGEDTTEADAQSGVWSFWLGLAGVAATKGGLALLLPVVGAGFLAWRTERGLRWSGVKRLLNPAAMGVGLLLAVGWYIAVLWQHGGRTEQFFDDQVGSRLGGGVWERLDNVLYPLETAWDFVPWSLLALALCVGSWGTVRSYARRAAGVLGLAAGWYGLLLLVFVWGDIHRVRYFLPAYPVLAVAIGGLLVWAASRERAAARGQGGFAYHLAWLGLFTWSVALLVVGSQASTWMTIGGGLGLMAAMVAWWSGRGAGAVVRFVLLAAALVFGIRSYQVFVQEAFFVSPVPELVALIHEHDPASESAAGEAKVLLYAPQRKHGDHPHQLRLLTGPKVHVAEARDEGRWSKLLDRYKLSPHELASDEAVTWLIVPEGHAALLPAHHAVVGRATGYHNLAPKHIRQWFEGRPTAEIQADRSLRYIVARPAAAPPAATESSQP